MDGAKVPENPKLTCGDAPSGKLFATEPTLHRTQSHSSSSQRPPAVLTGSPEGVPILLVYPGRILETQPMSHTPHPTWLASPQIPSTAPSAASFACHALTSYAGTSLLSLPALLLSPLWTHLRCYCDPWSSAQACCTEVERDSDMSLLLLCEPS
jgi:hypothetical protein